MNIKDAYNALKTVVKLEEVPSQIKDLSKRVAELESQSVARNQQMETLIERLAALEVRSQTQSDTWQKDFSEALAQLKILAYDGQRCREQLKEVQAESRDLVHQVIELKAHMNMLLGFAAARFPLSLPPAD